MFEYLQIYNPRERLAVGLADLALRTLTLPDGLRGVSEAGAEPRRVLVLRLERIGDLLMTFEALSALRTALPEAEIDLCVGRWNEPLARSMGVATRVDTLDAPWLARDQPSSPWRHVLLHTRRWRARRYDLAINLEPDIRSNLLLWLSGARRRVGYFTGGGGALLTKAAPYDAARHTRDNAVHLVHQAVPAARDLPRANLRLRLPDEARARAGVLLAPAAGSLCIGVHAGGGRPVKQWHSGRFAQVAAGLGREFNATIVLTGSAPETAVVREVEAAIPADVRVLNLSGQGDLLELAAVLERLAVFVTGDTGPMHLAAAVGTPLVAIFGPSDPVRYAPGTAESRVVRIHLPCSPCNRIRLPPERCRGHVPDCLDGVTVAEVLAEARGLLPPRSRQDPNTTGE